MWPLIRELRQCRGGAVTKPPALTGLPHGVRPGPSSGPQTGTCTLGRHTLSQVVATQAGTHCQCRCSRRSGLGSTSRSQASPKNRNKNKNSTFVFKSSILSIRGLPGLHNPNRRNPRHSRSNLQIFTVFDFETTFGLLSASCI